MQRGANSLLILTLVHFDGCNRAALLSDVALLGKMAVLGKLAFLGKVAVLGKFTSWQSHHWHHHQHPAGVDAVAALSSLQTLPWRSCGPPFHRRQRPPLGPRPFWSLPSAIGAHPGLCPFVVRLFQVDLLDCLGFGSRPDSRVARLRSRRRPSFGLRLLGRPLGALDTQRGGSASSSETLPALFFRRLSRFRAALFHFRGVTTPTSLTPAPASACDTPRRSLQRGRCLPLGLQCPITEATTNCKESCASAQY